MDIYLIRHTTPAIASGICYGRSDIDLSASFKQELISLQSKLPNTTHAAIYSSPLRRCRLAAEALTTTSENALIIDQRLMELNFGAWEMLAWTQIPEPEMTQWSQNYVIQGPPQGESFQDLATRAQDFFKQLMSDCKHDCVLVLTHAGVIRAWLADVLHMPLALSFRLTLDYGGVTKVNIAQQHCRIDYINR